MDPVDDRHLNELADVTTAVIATLEALGFIGRRLDPARLTALLDAVGAPDAALAERLGAIAGWTGPLRALGEPLESAAREALGGFAALRSGIEAGEIGAVFRAMRAAPRAMEALYPLAALLPPVNRFFLEPQARADAAAQARFTDPRPNTGVMHVGGEPGAPGGFSLYVPEDYSPGRAWPLIVALHGGSGNGGAFLWSWLRAARTRGMIVAAPTALGQTWSLSGPDLDSPNLARIVGEIGARWRLDHGRLLLTGMSDGGTFTYVSGLEPGSPFTHLAPVAAAFHPMLAQMADPERLAGLPIHIVHGARDWMFQVDMAREAASALEAAGGAVTYREIADLAHAYPSDMSVEILDWMDRTPRGGGPG